MPDRTGGSGENHAIVVIGLWSLVVGRGSFVKLPRPATNDQRATTKDQRPTTNDQRPTTNDQRPTTNDQRPTTNDQRPTTNDQRPTNNDQRPTTNDQRPTTNEQRPYAAHEDHRDSRAGERFRGNVRWSLVVGRCSLVVGRWSLVVGRWSLVVGRWSLVVGRWSLVVGRWSLVVGRWSLVVGRWSLVVGRWSLVVARWSFVAGRGSLTNDPRPTTNDQRPMTTIAWFSPLPPVRSGIADANAELLPHLERELAIDRYDEPRAHDFIWRNQRAPYDLIVYQLGNASCHDFVWAYLARFPGLVVVHDPTLHHARARQLLAERRLDGFRRRILVRPPGPHPEFRG